MSEICPIILLNLTVVPYCCSWQQLPIHLNVYNSKTRVPNEIQILLTFLRKFFRESVSVPFLVPVFISMNNLVKMVFNGFLVLLFNSMLVLFMHSLQSLLMNVLAVIHVLGSQRKSQSSTWKLCNIMTPCKTLQYYIENYYFIHLSRERGTQ